MVQFLPSVDYVVFEEAHFVPETPLLDFLRDRDATTARFIIFSTKLVTQVLPFRLAGRC